MIPALPMTQSSRALDHSEDRRDAAIGRTDRPGECALELDFAEAFERLPSLSFSRLMRIACGAVRFEARHQEAAESRTRLREHQVRIALRRGKEPLVSGDAPGATGIRFSARHVGADVGATLAFGHPHADQRRALASHGQRPRIVGVGEHAWQPDGVCVGQRRGVTRQDGHTRIGHRQRALRRSRPVRAGSTSRRAPPARPVAGFAMARSARLRPSRAASARAMQDETRPRRRARHGDRACATPADSGWPRRRARMSRRHRASRPIRVAGIRPTQRRRAQPPPAVWRRSRRGYGLRTAAAVGVGEDFHCAL